MNNSINTCSSHSTEINKENIEEIIKKLALHSYEKPELPAYKPGWFERLMNRLGWYRKTTVYVLDSKSLKFDYLPPLVAVELYKELTTDCVAGDTVTWKTIGGVTHTGKLKEWDSNVARVEENGKIVPVEC